MALSAQCTALYYAGHAEDGARRRSRVQRRCSHSGRSYAASTWLPTRSPPARRGLRQLYL